MKYIKTFFRLLLGRLATAEGMVAVVLQKEIADIEVSSPSRPSTPTTS